jgi:hypothetical protein
MAFDCMSAGTSTVLRAFESQELSGREIGDACLVITTPRSFSGRGLRRQCQQARQLLAARVFAP